MRRQYRLFRGVGRCTIKNRHVPVAEVSNSLHEPRGHQSLVCGDKWPLDRQHVKKFRDTRNLAFTKFNAGEIGDSAHEASDFRRRA